jgi:enamine deaminase RidA (YjgF/YER057c/UK114 family)
MLRMKRSILVVLVALAVCGLACARKPMKEFMNLDDKRPPGYTHVVTSPPGKMVFLSGMAGSNPDGSLPPDFRTQADNTFRTIGRALKMAGADFKDIVKINYFLADMKYIGELREVRANYLNMEAPPAATAVQSGLTGILLEIECIAIVPE